MRRGRAHRSARRLPDACAWSRAGTAERGIATPIAAVLALVLATAAMGAIGLGRMSVVRSDLQRAADAAALAATELIRLHGLPLESNLEQSAESTGQRSVNIPASFEWKIVDNGDHIDIEVVAKAKLELTQMVFGGTKELSRRAVARLPQTEITATERRRPKLAILLDYSGSMALPITGGGGERAVDILELSVNGLLDADLPVEYAAAFYNSGVFDFARFGPDAIDEIKDHMDFHDAAGGTGYSAPLSLAYDMLSSVEDTGYYVLMVSDGQPFDSPEAIRNAANRLWGIDATIFSLEIRRQGSSAELAQNLINISGTPASRGDTNYHFVAQTGQELVDQFTNIIAEIVCRAGPLDPVPSDPNDVVLLLTKPGVGDVELLSVADVFADPDLYGYNYDVDTHVVNLTDRACSAVLDQGYRLISRSERGRLAE